MGYSHLYVTAHGEWSSAPWLGEKAQIGLRVSRWGFNQPGTRIILPSLTDSTETFEETTSGKFRTLRTFTSDSDTSLAYPAIMDDIASDMDLFLTDMKAHQSSMFRWTEIRVAAIENATGKYLYPASRYEYLTPLAGAASAPMPPEVAIAMSYRTQVVGKRGRGRMYLPALVTGTLDGSGTVSSAKRTAITNSLKNLHDNLSNLPGIDTYNCGLVICSANSTSAIVPREVRVGSHFDVQRRRQHQVEEAYTSLSVG